MKLIVRYILFIFCEFIDICILVLLDLIEEILPSGQEEWEYLSMRFNNRLPDNRVQEEENL